MDKTFSFELIINLNDSVGIDSKLKGELPERHEPIAVFQVT